MDQQTQGDEGPQPRRLSAILALDLAGYSARSEADEAAAVRIIADLRAVIDREAAVHGGRIFNTAGDGFMLEFPTASQALEAAVAIAAAAPAPVRLGVHLGEVTPAAAGDLLGHGVNVAARLEALARPGAILVSDSARRAAVGPLGARLTPQGRIRLDKMRETVPVFGLDPKGGRGPLLAKPLTRFIIRFWPAIGAAAFVVVLTAGLFTWRAIAASGELKTAIAPFQVVSSDPASRDVGQMLPGRIAAMLTSRQAATVSADAAAAPGHGGARILVTGTVERAGDIVRVHVVLDDRRANQTLWSSDFEAPAGDADLLEDQVAAKLGDIVSFTTSAFASRAVDTETLAAFLHIVDGTRGGVPHYGELIEFDRRVVQRAPDFAAGHGFLAFHLAGSARFQAPAARVKMAAEARQEALRAIGLDPATGTAYVALATIEPPEDYARQEEILRRGLANAPDDSILIYNFAGFERLVGRWSEGRSYMRRSLEIDPLSPVKMAANIFAVAGNGDDDAAEQLIAQGMRRFPDSIVLRRAAVYTSALYAPPDVALAHLDASKGGEHTLSPPALALWREYVVGRKAGHVPRATLSKMAAAADAGLLDPTDTAVALAMGGDIDAALEVATFAYVHGVSLYQAVFFENAAAAMRRDVRFMALAARMGFVNYWMKTGEWPDFCADPKLPYSCKAEAAKVAGLWRPNG